MNELNRIFHGTDYNSCAAITPKSKEKTMSDLNKPVKTPALPSAVDNKKSATAVNRQKKPSNSAQNRPTTHTRAAPPASAPRPPRPAPVRNPLPEISFPEELPVSSRRDDIAQAILKHQVIIVCGETGSGKTTQLPKICLQLGRGERGLIGHTQPRRIAASSTAKRIAQELGSPLGEHVGFKVRFTDTLSAGASVKLMLSLIHI
jgi:ATP-dependent helicase HrpA